ncbi:MAG: hypothetical protein ACRDNW_04715 [Trebonia sp.]
MRVIAPGERRAGIVIGLFWAGCSFREIARYAGLRSSWVQGILLGAGEAERSGQWQGCLLPAALIAKRYESGESATALASEYGVWADVIRGIVEGAGLVVRDMRTAAHLRHQREAAKTQEHRT